MSAQEIARRRLHHGRHGFVNPWNPGFAPRPSQMIRWKLLSRNAYRHLYKNERMKPVTIEWEQVRGWNGVSVTFLAHATVMIRDMGTAILVDPVLFGLPWPIRNCTPIVAGISEMPTPEYVLITHGHYDHLDTKSLKLFAARSRFVAPPGYSVILSRIGVRCASELDWFGSLSDDSREIVFLPANHWTMRSPLIGPNTALWGSYIIKTKAGPVIYVAGDTAYFDCFEEIGKRFEIDLAIFNLSAYEPRWFMKNSHMNPSETVKAFQDLKAKRLMIVHWGTFRLGDEPVYLPHLEIGEEMSKTGLVDRLEQVTHGQSLLL